MESKTSTGNLLLFLVLTLVILFGAQFLQYKLFPPPPRPPAKLRVDPKLFGEVLLSTPGFALAPGVPGLGHAAPMSADTLLPQWLAEQKPAVAQKPQPKPPPKEPVAARPSAKPVEIPLGGAGYKLDVVLTSRGAGVQSVILNQFKGADQWGRPEEERLHLIPAEYNRQMPSYQFFHYDRPDDKHPLDTLGDWVWTVERHSQPGDAKQEAVFAADVPGHPLRIRKIYTLGPDDYHLGLTVEIQHTGATGEAEKFRYQLTGAHGLPIEGVWYTNTYRNALIGMLNERKGLWRDFQDSRSISFLEGGNEVVKKEGYHLQYAAVAVQYFASVIAVDDQQVEGQEPDFLVRARPTVEGPRNSQKPSLDDITVRVITDEIKDLKPGGKPVVHKYLLYNGPIKVRLLGDLGVPQALVQRYETTLHLNTLTDYPSPGPFGYIGSKILMTDAIIFFTNWMHRILWGLHKVIPNYGLCIILLTLLVRGLMHPVSRKQARTTLKMQALAPELKKLQEKHKNDRQALGMAQMKLYREHGVNPVGSCWIIFLQLPIFMGLYYALQESIHFRLASFLWMKNLAAPDMLFEWGEKIPLISNPDHQGIMLLGLIPNIFYLGPCFNLLPVIAVALMVLQQKFLMPPPTDEQQEMQQKMMKYMMIFMGLMFYKVAAGLCIYFIVSSVWGMAERQLLPKTKPAGSAVTTPEPARSSSKPAAARAKSRPSTNGQPDGVFQKIKEMWAELLKQAKKK
jgi:YidC/Oxa1 family membrane protein insertase